ncbi:MAG: ATP synthase F1 subunit gamma [Deltaproteobacteria bacterium]|nr:ATP synthase F1 subunit gamma [Deltaproteobacteria bacterium]
MPGLKEIRRRIGTVMSTKQITRAMKLVSAAKLKRAQDLVTHGREFSTGLIRLMATIKSDLEARELSNPAFMAHDSIKHRTVIILSADRGLCGGYNTNLGKAFIAQESPELMAKTDYIVLGRKGVSLFRRLKWQAKEEHEGLAENPVQWPLDHIAGNILNAFLRNETDEVSVYYTQFLSGLSQRPVKEIILPIPATSDLNADGHADSAAPTSAAKDVVLPLVKYSPSAEEILRGLIPMLIKTQLRQAAFEARASEHAARMAAMDSATHNADELIYKLQLFYNRARQSAITRELIEVLGGAEAIK